MENGIEWAILPQHVVDDCVCFGGDGGKEGHGLGIYLFVPSLRQCCASQ
jgi:hypothetical protein